MAEITELLRAQEGREAPDLGPVFERLYADLKRIARARVGQLCSGDTLGATALVHEAFLKLSGSDQLSLTNRRHFFTCAALAMRQILVDNARSANAEKRGAGLEQVTLGHCDAEAPAVGLPDLDLALDDLDRINPELRELVELRYFAGLSMPVIAELRGVSLRTVTRDWERARSLLQLRLSADGL
ncbi:ECF-type sigma factor [Dokdonella sp.]|uniref:ECF-type sigma factor n=1 Tax=Dokdonella sp. TaxID=2291710 RepID=UPI003C647D5B